MKIGIKDHDDCFFCDSKPETVEHLFCYCERIFYLWNALAHWTLSVKETEIEFSLESVILSYTNCMPCKKAINCIILVGKFFIYKCKMEGRNPDFAGIQNYLKFDYNIEKFVCDFALQDRILRKWELMNKLYILSINDVSIAM